MLTFFVDRSFVVAAHSVNRQMLRNTECPAAELADSVPSQVITAPRGERGTMRALPLA